MLPLPRNRNATTQRHCNAMNADANTEATQLLRQCVSIVKLTDANIVSLDLAALEKIDHLLKMTNRLVEAEIAKRLEDKEKEMTRQLTAIKERRRTLRQPSLTDAKKSWGDMTSGDESDHSAVARPAWRNIVTSTPRILARPVATSTNARPSLTAGFRIEIESHPSAGQVVTIFDGDIILGSRIRGIIGISDDGKKSGPACPRLKCGECNVDECTAALHAKNPQLLKRATIVSTLHKFLYNYRGTQTPSAPNRAKPVDIDLLRVVVHVINLGRGSKAAAPTGPITADTFKDAAEHPDMHDAVEAIGKPTDYNDKIKRSISRGLFAAIKCHFSTK